MNVDMSFLMALLGLLSQVSSSTTEVCTNMGRTCVPFSRGRMSPFSSVVFESVATAVSHCQAQIVEREVEYAKLPLKKSKVAAVSLHVTQQVSDLLVMCL